MEIKKVYLIFKTHLDIGFTDYAKNVREKYLTQHIPNAISAARELQGTDTPFVWTVGSWLIQEALKRDDGTVEQAIRDGLIRWHALPFTTHTEFMTEELFEEGLKISKELDQRFGMQTHAAKMTDVPGHTIAMLPLLSKYGIHFLHVGVNGASMKPDVPPLFIWERDGHRVIVACNGGGYGGQTEVGDCLFLFCHTLDNVGAQSVEQIRGIYQQTREAYPGAEVLCGTLEDFLDVIDPSALPVVTDEIGDSWIHGVGTDPYKAASYRAVLRYAKENALPIPEELLMVAEHTWGMDIKTYYPHTDGWFNEEFAADPENADRKVVEKAWTEQREYVFEAARKLGYDVQMDMQCATPDISGLAVCDHAPNVTLQWQLFCAEDYRRYEQQYMLRHGLSKWDFTKFGLPEYDAITAQAKPVAAWKTGEVFWSELRFDPALEEKYGLPTFFVREEGESVEVRMVGKQASRLPQALWLKFNDFDGAIEVNKLGQWINPTTARGCQLIMGFDSGIRNENREIVSLDAALVAPFGKRLLEYGVTDLVPEPWFNLYNNIWNTNFPMWFSDNVRFRFMMHSR